MNKHKIAKVVGTCFVSREVRLQDTWPNHAQNLPTPNAVLNMIKDLVENEKQTDAGQPMDTFIVNNHAGYSAGAQFLDSIHNTPTKNGVFKILHRENSGRSFGAYNHAFNLYKNEYEYWLFSEDDMCFSKKGYASEYLNVLNENENCAFVASIGVGRAEYETKHAHGGCGLTHRDYMKKTIPMEYRVDSNNNKDCFKIGGSLAHYPGTTEQENKNTRIHCVGGEVPFTYSLVRLGYDILTVKNPQQWFQFYEKNNI